jgi:hypothetical protein
MTSRLCRLLLAAGAIAASCGGALAAPFCAVYPNERSCTFYDIDTCRFATFFAGFCMFNEDEARPVANARFCLQTPYRLTCVYDDVRACRQAAATVGGACVANAGR